MEKKKLNQSNLSLPSPLQLIEGYLPITTYCKRDDMISEYVSGNKYRKLKYILNHVIQSGHSGIITYGGPFSNHIYATAAYCHRIGLPSIGIIRGEDDPNNPTLDFVRNHDMQLYFISREDYKNKESGTLKQISSLYSSYFTIPEGGAHPLALSGVIEMIDELDFEPDFIACAVGTGTTAAGILKAVVDNKWKTRVLAFSSMKNETLEESILNLSGLDCSESLIFLQEYNYGGYAKLNEELLLFDKSFLELHGFRLDPIYTLKMVYGLKDYFIKNRPKPNQTLVFYHSGGLQGWNGVEYIRSKKK